MEDNRTELGDQIANNIDEHEYVEESDQELELDLPLKEKKILWQPMDLSIRDLGLRKEDGDLILQPDYQRKFVMRETQASRLIESILMNVPIPTIYLAEEEDG